MLQQPEFVSNRLAEERGILHFESYYMSLEKKAE